MRKDVFDDLLKHLGEVGQGFPQDRKLLKVLKDYITPEEAGVALGLPTRLPPLEVASISVIATKLNRPVEEVEKHLESLSKKGFLVKKIDEAGQPGYAFMQMGFGMPQLFYWGGNPSEITKKNTLRLKTYMKSVGDDLSSVGDAKHFRYIPVSEAVSRISQTVLPYDRIFDLVKKSRRIAVVHCACREQMRIMSASDSGILSKLFAHYVWKKKSECTHTIENCLKFNDMADYVLEKGLGREISIDEALEIIKETEEEGLIHFVDNCEDEEGLHHMCNCCSDCCWQLVLIRNGWAKRDDIMATYYRRDTIDEQCNGCSLCVKDCPMELIKVENKQVSVDESKCVGCGLCVRRCSKKAAILTRRDDSVPFKDFITLHETAIKNVVNKEKE